MHHRLTDAFAQEIAAAVDSAAGDGGGARSAYVSVRYMRGALKALQMYRTLTCVFTGGASVAG